MGENAKNISQEISKFLKDAIDRVIRDVARELYADRRMESGGGTVPLQEYCSRFGLTPRFDDPNSPLLKCNPRTAEFEADFGLVVIEDVCVRLECELSQSCKRGLQFLKTLLTELKNNKNFSVSDATKAVEEFQKHIRVIYNDVSQTINKDLNKNLLIVDQVVINVANACKRLSGVEQVLIRNSMGENDMSNLKRNSKVRISIVQDDAGHPDFESRQQEGQSQGGKNSPEIDSEKEFATCSSKICGRKREKTFPERISKSYSELAEGYTRVVNVNAGSWYKSSLKSTYVIQEPLPLKEIFTNLRLRNGSREIEMKETLNQSCKDNVKDDLMPLVLIQGLSGSGKTSLCYHYVFEWLKGQSKENFLHEFDLVILIEASRVRSGRLKEFLRDELLPKSTSDMDGDDIIPWLKTLDILFIFDGYYEMETVSYDIIEDVLAKFSDQRIIITTRPEVQQDFVFMARRHYMDYCSLDLCGFDVPRLRDFTFKVFNVIEKNEAMCKTQSEAFLSYINGRGRVLDKHLKLPLTILLLILLWKEQPEILNAKTTGTRLYGELYRLYFIVLTERTSKYFHGISQISHILQNLQFFIGEKAWNMVKSGTTTVSESTMTSIREECQGKGIRVRELMSALHMYQIDNNPSACKLKVAFQHRTQMYYFAATYLASLLQRHVIELQNIEACPGVEHVLMFIMGHLADQNTITDAFVHEAFQIISKFNIDPTKYEFWWNMLLESKFQPQVAFHIGKEKLPQKHWQLNEVNVVRGLRLLALTPLKLWSLIIDIPDGKEPYGIPSFLNMLVEAGKQINRRQKRIVRIDMHLRHHEKNGIKHSDNFLRALHPWADLQSFTGHLGEQEAGEEIFGSYINLTIINVKVSTLNSLNSLTASLRKIYRMVRTLHVTIALPKSTPTEMMTILKTAGTLEVSVPDMENQYKEWLVEVITKVGGRNGVWRLNLLRSRLTYDAVEWLANQLKGRIQDKMNIETKE